MTNKAAKTRVALYARISTVNHGQDTGLQVEEMRQVAQQRGWTITGEYIDEGISGSRQSRPALDQLLADAQAGKFDMVCVWKLDRLGRSLQNLLNILDQFTRWGIGFVSLHDAGLDTVDGPSRTLLLSLLGAFAQYEHSMIKDRVCAGVRRAKAQGKHCGRPEVKVDVRPAVALLNEGRSLKETASILDIPRSTLRRRLHEAGYWPLGGVSKTLPPEMA